MVPGYKFCIFFLTSLFSSLVIQMLCTSENAGITLSTVAYIYLYFCSAFFMFQSHEISDQAPDGCVMLSGSESCFCHVAFKFLAFAFVLLLLLLSCRKKQIEIGRVRCARTAYSTHYHRHPDNCV